MGSVRRRNGIADPAASGPLAPEQSVNRIVYGASPPKAGALGGLLDLNALPHTHRLVVRRRVLESECAERLTRFFQGLRSQEG